MKTNAAQHLQMDMTRKLRPLRASSQGKNSWDLACPPTSNPILCSSCHFSFTECFSVSPSQRLFSPEFFVHHLGEFCVT